MHVYINYAIASHRRQFTVWTNYSIVYLHMHASIFDRNKISCILVPISLKFNTLNHCWSIIVFLSIGNKLGPKYNIFMQEYRFKMSSVKWRPICFGPNVLMIKLHVVCMSTEKYMYIHIFYPPEKANFSSFCAVWFWILALILLILPNMPASLAEWINQL